MASAAEIVRNPRLDIDPITAQTASSDGYTDDELAHFRIRHDEIRKLPVTIYNYGKKGTRAKTNLRPHVTDAIFEDSIDKTPTFTVVIHDPSWDLLNTGALGHTIDLNPGKIPHRWYRLDSVAVADDDITLVFATRNAVLLSYKKRPHKANRKRVTRAQFIKSLLHDVKKTRIKFYCPQLNKKQKIRKTRFDSETTRSRGHEKGFTSSDKITVKHQPANPAQRRVIEKTIQAGIDEGMPGLVIVSGVMCTIQESTASEHPPPNGQFVGAFQQSKAYGWPATTDAYKDAKGYYSKAIKVYKSHTSMDLGTLVGTVQGVIGSTNPLNSGYVGSTNRWRDEAQHAVNAFGGVEVGDPGSMSTVNFKKKYEFMVGPPDGTRNENYLAAIYRMADEVHWSAFWVKDVLHFLSEEDLFKSKARFRLRRGWHGVESVSFGWDRGKRVNQMTVRARMERWICPVGTVVTFDEGGPARGRWLVTNIRRSMFDELGEITLSKPMRERLEPAQEAGQRSVQPKGGGAGGFGGDLSALGLLTIEDISSSWSPQRIIEQVVRNYAKFFKMNTGVDIAAIRGSNVTGHVADSDHHQPWNVHDAIDMSNGGNPTPEMDDLASALIMAFNMPDLDNPNATRKNGQVLGNLVNAYHKGFRFQLIYRTFLVNGGDHYHHVHFGCRRMSKPNIPIRPGFSNLG